MVELININRSGKEIKDIEDAVRLKNRRKMGRVSEIYYCSELNDTVVNAKVYTYSYGPAYSYEFGK